MPIPDADCYAVYDLLFFLQLLHHLAGLFQLVAA